MLAHKLVLDAVVDQPFILLAIHSSVEEHKLAYLLNKHLKLQLSRTRKDIDLFVNKIQTLFTLFKFNDKQQYCSYYLISNKTKGISRATNNLNSLFGEEEISTNTVHLLPKLKKVDFFLKIEAESALVKEKDLLQIIKQIPQVSTAYFIDQNQLESKENLIFD